ncbi:MAG: glutamine amidotransferase [Eubacterium sp.]|nr:glutamine amidotransferase [Eubacterium sp.]MCR4847074.1 glutamine amidotransferase [Eubacterium sp.]
MSDQIIKIAHLYPEVLNLYGDRGNIICLEKRLKWRNIGCEITEVKLGQSDDLTDYDIFFIGGGQDFEQEVLLKDLKSGRGNNIKAAIEDGKTFLCICGGYQMMGHYYETKDGEKMEFLGAIDFHTIGGDVRMIGNYAFHTTKSAGKTDIVGFENHSGRTYLGRHTNPLGTILSGYGNNGEDKTEGVHYKNVYGSYSHGPILPKNPVFADHLLKTALERKYGSAELAPLNDTFETQAHDYIFNKVLNDDMSKD